MAPGIRWSKSSYKRSGVSCQRARIDSRPKIAATWHSTVRVLTFNRAAMALLL
jgi:hypothetical protein